MQGTTGPPYTRHTRTHATGGRAAGKWLTNIAKGGAPTPPHHRCQFPPSPSRPPLLTQLPTYPPSTRLHTPLSYPAVHRAACRAWRRDVDRCLHRLHLRNPTPVSLHRLGNTFSRLQTVKLTVLSAAGPHKDQEAALNAGCGLPGALGRVRVLRLRSKRPGGVVLPVGQLQLLRGGAVGASLTCLCLSACEVQSWSGLQVGKQGGRREGRESERGTQSQG